MSLQGKRLSRERMCQLAGVSRAGSYRDWQEKEPEKEEMEVRSAIEEIAVEHRRHYGSRRIRWELQARGLYVNRKRIQRIQREDDLLGIQPRRFVRTTQAKPGLQVYWNLARHLQLTGLDQLWVADITYIRLQVEFVYLALLLDAFSRRVVGWALSQHVNHELTLLALQRALARRQPRPGLVHHSDRGWQYAGAPYVRVLRQHGIEISMSRAGNPYDNALCESFIKTLKKEEIYCTDYRDLQHLEANLEAFVEQYYNRRRLHSALNYCSPQEFERKLRESPPSNLSSVPRLSFSGHGTIFQCNGEQPQTDQDRSPTHCLDESSTGYSSVGCSPAEPACASPAADDSEGKE
jgi:putative transposase